MKTNNLLAILTIIICTIIFVSCGNEDETFHPLKLEADGIDLVQDKSDQYKLLGKISASDTEFSLQGTDKYSDMAYVTEVTIDGIRYEIENNHEFNDKGIFKGDWGQIVNSSATRPFTMYFQIKSNTSDKERMFHIVVGYGYWYRNIDIVQAKKTPANS